MRVPALARIALVCTLGVGLGACGSGKHRSAASIPSAASSNAVTQADECTRAAHAVASTLTSARGLSALVYTASDGSNGCLLQRLVGGRARVRVDIRVDTSPQPFERLDREQIEFAQNVVWSHSGRVPQPIAGLGEAAFWFAHQSRLAATDGKKLVSVVVTGTAIPRQRRLAAADRIARGVLRTT